MRPKQRDRQQQQRGFSLIEMAIVLVISSVVGGAIYQTFHTQQRTYQRQNTLAEMQQNVRGSTFILTRELRMAGYDPALPYPVGVPGAAFGFVTQFPVPHAAVQVNYAVDTDKIAFTADVAPTDNTLDLVPAELIAYRFNRANRTLERYNATSSLWDAVAEDIDGVHFAYFTVDALGNVVPTANPAVIRSVQVSLVIRAGQQDPTYKEAPAKIAQRKSINGGVDFCLDCAAEPHYRRQLWSTTVQIRNL